MKGWVIAGAAVFGIMVPGIVVIAAASAGAATACSTGGQAKQVQGTSLDPEQLGNAQTIIATARALTEKPYAGVVAVATAMQESSLHNTLEQLDHDSIGLFQQRISIYGAATAGDPVKATTAFIERLVKVDGWETMPLTQAAQAVQISAFPDAYAKWQGLADELVKDLWPGAATTCDGGTTGGTDAGGGIPPGLQLPSNTQQAAAVVYALNQLGKPYVWGAEGPDSFDCSGLMMAAWAAAGVAIPRTTYNQVTTGVPVASIADLQPGDLIFIPGSDGTVAHPGHVGMYVGVGSDGAQYLVQAPHTGDVVKVTAVSNWQSQIVAIRRPLRPTR